MTGEYVLASDLGSGGCKTVILSTAGQVVAAAQQEYPTSYPHPGWVEQDPEDWYGAFCATTRAVLADSGIDRGQIVGVGIVGVTHNAVLLGKDDRPLCPSILIFDNRSTVQVQSILDRWGKAVFERTLNEVTPVWTWPQLLWIRENRPEVWRRTRSILFQKDYVRHRLAPSRLTDVIDAGGTLLFDPLAETWIEEFCNDLGVAPSWLPPVLPSLDVVGQVSRQGAADTGLLPGTPVIAGTTDTVSEMLGSGGVRAGCAIVKLASVGRIAVVTHEPVRAPHILNYRHVLDGLWYPGTASKYAASAYRWLRDVMWPAACQDGVYRLMDEAAGRVPPGCNGLVFHPHLMGEWAPYWDEAMRGDFVGLTVRHTRAHLTRAVLEGVAFALKDALGEMEGLGLQADDIRLIGQGARSHLWAIIVANVFNRPLHIPQEPDAAYGGALITAMGVNVIERTPTALDSMIRMRNVIMPDQEMAAAYEKLHDIYRETDAAMRGLNARLHRFEQEQAQGEVRSP